MRVIDGEVAIVQTGIAWDGGRLFIDEKQGAARDRDLLSA